MSDEAGRGGQEEAAAARGWAAYVTWARFDDQFPSHPKIAGISDGAFRAHVSGVCYCCQYLTDGILPPAADAMFGKRRCRELVAAGVWEQRGSGYRIHDFLDYNPSREAEERKREQARKRMERARNKRVCSREQSENFAGIGHNPVPEPLPQDLLPVEEEGVGTVTRRSTLPPCLSNHPFKGTVPNLGQIESDSCAGALLVAAVQRFGDGALGEPDGFSPADIGLMGEALRHGCFPDCKPSRQQVENCTAVALYAMTKPGRSFRSIARLFRKITTDDRERA